MSSFAFLSLGLGGSLADEHTYEYVYKLSDSDSLEDIIKYLSGRSQSIDALDIYAHGKVVRELPFLRQRGGYGAYLGKENLKPATAKFFKPLRHHWGRWGWINLYVCSIADRSGETSPGVFAQDGFKLCGSIAKHAGTTVRAGAEIQEYRYDGDGDNPQNMNFGDWEGPVFNFHPDGTVMED